MAEPDCEGDYGGGPFGVRRPLRYLAFKLDLSEDQVAQLAAILDDLKTERAQAAIDHRRTTAAFADAIAAEAFDEAQVERVSQERIAAAERVRAAVLRALRRLHGLLADEQRKKLAYLLRTGAIMI